MGKEYRLAHSGRLNGIQITKGDILREKQTSKTVKVLNVLKNEDGHEMLQVEYNGPSSSGSVFQKPIDSFCFLS